MDISTVSVRRTLHELKLYPYRIAVWQELKLPDYARHLHFCRLGFKPIPECATLDSRVSDQGRICDFIY